MMRRPFSDWNPGWRTKAVAAALGGISAFFSLGSPQAYGWWGAITCATAALIVPVLAFRRLWRSLRFWGVLALLAGFQVPIVIFVRPYVERLRLGFMLFFGAVDCIFVITAIYYSCSEPVDSEQ